MSLWQDHTVGNKIVDILRQAESYVPGHHFGKPYLTPYQIAIIFKEKHPKEFLAIATVIAKDAGKAESVGGKDHGEHNSFSQYIARELSRDAKHGTLPIEGAFLSRGNVNGLSYRDGDIIVESSLGVLYDLSMFRIKA